MITSSVVLKEAIKCVGVGKKGSKDLPGDLTVSLSAELLKGDVSRAALGAFVGALILKGVSDHERALESSLGGVGVFSDHARLVKIVAPDAPAWVQQMCVDLLSGALMDQVAAERLGDFLMSDCPGDGARGLVASVLRVRYESDDEYEGLLQSLTKTFDPVFGEAIPDGEPVLQIAEPFDGVDHSYMITPLVSAYLQSQGYRVVSLCGRNSGPKFGNNLHDVARNLRVSFLPSTADLKNVQPFGFYLDQKDLSAAMDRWVDIRHQTVKRPFLSTIERFVNPLKAQCCLASAFHPPYGEKMLTLAERAGFPRVIIVRNGIEGTTAFALKRATKVLCSVKRSDGRYERLTFEVDPRDVLGSEPEREEVLERVSPEINAGLIKTYQRAGQTDNPLFDARVKLTCAGLSKVLEFVNS